MPYIAREAGAQRFARAGGDYLLLVNGNQPRLLEDGRVLADSTHACKTSRCGGLEIT
jgi:hypothetical protein